MCLGAQARAANRAAKRDYEYSLDGITYQESNIFYDLTQSDYTVYIRDRNGCGVYIEELFLLRYPKFFTPNKFS